MHQFRQRTFEDVTQDVSLDFMEQEIGRHDWRNNWDKVKEAGDVRAKIKAWLERMAIDHDPQLIVDYLDDLHRNNEGRWL